MPTLPLGQKRQSPLRSCDMPVCFARKLPSALPAALGGLSADQTNPARTGGLIRRQVIMQVQFIGGSHENN